jgi:hypothetical protein
VRNNIYEVIDSKTKNELDKNKYNYIDQEFTDFLLQNNNKENIFDNNHNRKNIDINKRDLKGEINFSEKDFKYIYGISANINNSMDFKSENDKRHDTFKILSDEIKLINDEIDYLEKYIKNTKDEIKKHLDSNN